MSNKQEFHSYKYYHKGFSDAWEAFWSLFKDKDIFFSNARPKFYKF